MKLKSFFVAAVLAATVDFGVSSAFALSATRVAAIKTAIEQAPVPELAARAASLVAQSEESERQSVALELVRMIVSKKPMLAPAVVGAISKIAPEESAVVAGEAALLSKEQATEIVKAAISAAPGQARNITSAVAKVHPKAATSVTRTAVTLVPTSSNEIIEQVVATVPTEAGSIQKDFLIVRSTRKSASTGDTQGIVTSRPGTIRGEKPSGAPTEVKTVTPGADSDRQNYGKPK